MIIKQSPEDFLVDEIPVINTKKYGAFCVYKLEKTNMDWMAAKKLLVKKIKVSPKTVAYAGIKDKIATTSQYISIKTDLGDRANVQMRQLSLTFIGRSDVPLKSGDLKGNKFTITLRDCSDEEIELIKKNAERIKKVGIPNYFDEQRFGEDLTTGGFVAKRLMKGDYETALRLFLASQNNRLEDKNTLHAFIHKYWKKWARCLEYAEEFPKLDDERKILDCLVKHPEDFVYAFKLINAQKKELLVSAYQSFLWNKCLSLLLKKNDLVDKEVPYVAGKFLFYDTVTDEQLSFLKAKHIPMLDTKTLIADPDVKEIVKIVLEKERIEQKELHIKKMRNLFFKERKRESIVFAHGLKLTNEGPDETHEDKKKITIYFSLPKGAYATMVIKALQL